MAEQWVDVTPGEIYVSNISYAEPLSFNDVILSAWRYEIDESLGTRQFALDSIVSQIYGTDILSKLVFTTPDGLYEIIPVWHDSYDTVYILARNNPGDLLGNILNILLNILLPVFGLMRLISISVVKAWNWWSSSGSSQNRISSGESAVKANRAKDNKRLGPGPEKPGSNNWIILALAFAFIWMARSDE